MKTNMNLILDAEQRAAVEATGDKTLVLAGAGSGKTRTLAARIIHLIQNGAHPSRIAAITFTQAAAKELQDRINQSLEDGAEPLALGYVGTIHGYALRILNAYGSSVGLPPKLSVMDEEQAAEALERVIDELHYRFSQSHLREAIPDELEKLSLNRRTRHHGGSLSKEELVAFEFVNRMIEGGVLSFDAILALATHALIHCNGAGPEADHLLVDEAQDCGDLEFRFIMNHPGAKFLVGDPDQSVMGFLGANPRNLIDLWNRWSLL